MDYVDLQRRRRGRDRRKFGAMPRSVVRDPLFLVGTGFVLGSATSFLFFGLNMPGITVLLPFVAAVALLLYILWLQIRGNPAEIAPRLGSEKQLLMAIQDAGAITPVEAALETSLTVDEAEEILTRFADRGHLIVQSHDGALLYTLPGRRTAGTRTL